MTVEATQPGQLLSVEAVAQKLDIGAVTVRRMIRRRELPAVRLSKNMVRIKQSDLEAYVNSKKI